MPNVSERLKQLRKEYKLTQKDVAQFLGITESGYGYYEQGRNEPSIEVLKSLAEKYDVSVSYLLGETDIKKFGDTISVAGQEITLTPDERKVFEEMKKHPVMFNDLQSDPEKKIKRLIKMWEFIKEDLEEDDEEPDDIIKDD